ncbi:hypothetical protein PsYK624_052130 [Phanerochaete sordida]|uniref:Uncharacterized protein n=1 Tax=Phanerochaete sordida TaxID=48140 RepID=A0A9P3G830_9APHY|nr:hypothetical protein PsYK624_052130 [Phanerochaete sordida]
MSGLPPLSAEPGTPAHEWAAKTTSALEPSPAAPASTTMNPTTRQLFEEKNMRPGTTATDPLANPTSESFAQPPSVPLAKPISDPLAQPVHDPLAKPMSEPLAKPVFEPLTSPVSEPFTQPASSALDTPGREVPGAYPDERELEPRGAEINRTMAETASTAAATAGGFAQSAQQAAATYLPKAAETVGAYLPKSVVDTMSSYVPGMSNPQGAVQASEHDKIHTTSLPSTELAGQFAGERTDGAGALPGPVGESEVSKLPDERNATVPTAGTMAATAVGAAGVAAGTAAGYGYSAAQSAKDTAAGAAGSTAGAAQAAKDKVIGGTDNTSTALTGPQTHAVTTKYSLPSEEATGAKPFEHSDGAGALPGKRTEPAVAAMPEENTRGSTFATNASVGTHARPLGTTVMPTQDDTARDDLHQVRGNEVTGGVGRLPGKAGEEGVAVLPDERHGGDFKQTAELAGAGAAAAGMGKWALDDKTKGQQQQQPMQHAKVGEDMHLADSAKTAGIEKANTAPAQQPAKELAKPAKETHEAPKQEEPKKDTEKHEGQGHSAPKGKPNKGDGYDTDYHPAQLHPDNADYSKQQEEMKKDDPEADVTGAKHADSKEPASTGSAPATAGRDEAAREDKEQQQDDKNAHPDKAKKVGFMAKMKGEAKVLIGKVEGKKDKVEQGQRMKAGENVQ